MATPVAPQTPSETQAPAARQVPAIKQTPVATQAPYQALFDIDAYDVDGNTVLDQETIESAIYPYTGPDRTKEDVTRAKDALLKAYQSRGYQSVIVDIPAQDVRTKIIKLHVVEEQVGRLRVVGSNYNSLEQIKSGVPSIQEGKVPNFNQTQNEITELNRLPIRNVTPLIKPGKIPGTVDIDLKVKDTLPVQASFEVNNDHAQNTTPIRATATASYDNLWQLGHTLALTALVAPINPADSQVYSASYTAPIENTPWSILADGYVSNSNVAALGGTSVLGNGFAVSLRGILGLAPWGELAQTLNGGIDFKHFLENDSFGGVSTGPAIVDVYAPLSASYSLQRADNLNFDSLNLSLTVGLRGLGSSESELFAKRASARANFLHGNLDAQTTQDIKGFGQIFAKFSGQIADGPLLPSEEFSAGGLTTVRGYLQSEILGDEGGVGSFELRSPSLSSFVNDLVDFQAFDELRVYGFSDIGYALVLDPLPEQKSNFHLASFGLGTRFGAFAHLSSDVLVAVPIWNGVTTRRLRPYLQFTVKTEL